MYKRQRGYGEALFLRAAANAHARADRVAAAGKLAQHADCLLYTSDAAAALCALDDLIITADTMVFLGNDRLGKPRDEEDALRMLRALSGRAHTVCTGVSVRRGAQEERFAVSTRVFFRPMTDDEIRAYIKTGEPMDKAGAYGVQSRGALFVERIDGDFFNVMGLPVEQLGLVLARFGVKLL